MAAAKAKTRVFVEPYSADVVEELEAAWVVEKARLADLGVEVPSASEELARRVFFSGYATAMIQPPF